MVAQILKRERAEEFLFKPHSKKLEAASFTGRFLAKMLIVSIKQMNTIPSLSSVSVLKKTLETNCQIAIFFVVE